MKYSLILALSTLLTYTNAQVGPIRPEYHPAASLKEAVHRMRLSLDRELLYLARLQAHADNPSANPSTTSTTRQAASETLLDEDDGFTEVVNDGNDIFRPILPGVRVPAANEFADTSPMPSEEPQMETPAPPTITSPLPSDPLNIPDLLPSLPPDSDELLPSPGAVEPTVTPSPGTEDTEDGPSPTPTSGAPGASPSAEGTMPPESGFEGAGSPEPSPAEEDDDPVCFPADATVELEDGSFKTMANVQLGDRVRVGRGHFSHVFMFTHKLAHVGHRFVRIHTQSGHSLALTKAHYLYVNGVTAAASTVKAGDSVMLADYTLSIVSRVDEVVGRGLFNPQTVHGDIVVNGVRATTYTRAVEQRTAHALLAPLRAAFVSIGWSLSVFDDGANRLASLVPSGSLL